VCQSRSKSRALPACARSAACLGVRQSSETRRRSLGDRERRPGQRSASPMISIVLEHSPATRAMRAGTLCCGVVVGAWRFGLSPVVRVGSCLGTGRCGYCRKTTTSRHFPSPPFLRTAGALCAARRHSVGGLPVRCPCRRCPCRRCRAGRRRSLPRAQPRSDRSAGRVRCARESTGCTQRRRTDRMHRGTGPSGDGLLWLVLSGLFGRLAAVPLRAFRSPWSWRIRATVTTPRSHPLRVRVVEVLRLFSATHRSGSPGNAP